MEYPKKELSRSRVEWVRRTQSMDVLWLACLTLVVMVVPPGWRSLLLASRPLKNALGGVLLSSCSCSSPKLPPAVTKLTDRRLAEQLGLLLLEGIQPIVALLD